MTPSFSIKPMTETDLAELPSLQPEGWADPSISFKTYLQTSCSYPFAVKSAGVLIGCGCAIGLGKTGWLGHVIVSAGFRNRGIGTAIVSHLMDDLLSRGCETVSLIATDLGYPRYAAAGFRNQTEYLFFEKDAEPEPHTPFGTLCPKDLEAVLRMDHEFSGEDRSAFIIPQSTGGIVFRRDGITTGLWLPAFGEGLIIAGDPATGRMISALRSRVSGKCTLPAGNTDGVKILTDFGFHEVRRGWRMIYGREFAWKPEGIYSRMGGHLG